MKFPVIYEDNHLLVVDKPAGWIVQGATESDTSLLVEASRYLRDRYHKPGNVFLGVVSRLDRCVTGVLPLARTSKAAARLSEQFRKRLVEKVYWGVITGRPPKSNDRIRHWLVRDDRRAKTFCRESESDGSSEGILSYRLVQAWDQFSLLEIALETGRKHQIRAQMEAIGCPIVGDHKYSSSLNWSDSIALHCRSVMLEHPTLKTKLRWQAPLPVSWNQLRMPRVDETHTEDRS